jgi:hypothetical protein
MTPLRHSSAIIVIGLLLCAGQACTKTALPATPPAITGITPNVGAYSLRVFVTIYGSHFSGSKTTDLVAFNGMSAEVQTAACDSLIVLVPEGAGSGPVTVSVNGQTAVGPVFTRIAVEDVKE